MTPRPNPTTIIPKRHYTMVTKFNQDLEAFRQERGTEIAELYEDPITTFGLKDVRIDPDGFLRYTYSFLHFWDKNDRPREEEIDLLKYDEEEDLWYENENDWAGEGLLDLIPFWRACLRRAKRYWNMSGDKFDSLTENPDLDTED